MRLGLISKVSQAGFEEGLNLATALPPPLSPPTNSTVDQWLMETTQDKSNQKLEAAISYIQNIGETAKQTHFLNKRLLSPQPTAPEGLRAPRCPPPPYDAQQPAPWPLPQGHMLKPRCPRLGREPKIPDTDASDHCGPLSVSS